MGLEVLQRLDTMPQAVTAWEAQFLDSILRQVTADRALSDKQFAVVLRMCSTYLGEETAEALARHYDFDC